MRERRQLRTAGLTGEAHARAQAGVANTRREELTAIQMVDLTLSYSDVERQLIDAETLGRAATAACPWVVDCLEQALGTYGARTRTPDEIWNTRASSIDYVPERSTTPAAWALAFTPVITVLSQAAILVLTGMGLTPWVWLVGAAIMPVLWIIIWVRRDRIALDEWGHLRRAHWGWAFLTEVGYLTARTIVVRRQSGGRGWGPLVVNLLIIAVLVNVGIFTPNAPPTCGRS